MNRTDVTELRTTSRRLALQFSGLIVVLFALLIGVTFAIVGASQSAATTRSLVNASSVHSPDDAPQGVLVAIQFGDNTAVSQNAPPWFPDRAAMRALRSPDDVSQISKTSGGHSYAVMTSTQHGQVVQVAVDTHESTEELQRLALALIISGLLAVIASVLVGTAMARRAIRPMADALALQRRFVADASHELRMPLTLLSTRAQLLRRNLAESGVSIEGGLDEILQDSRDLTEILEDLLISADPREVGETVRIDLNTLTAECVAAMQAAATSRSIQLTMKQSEVAVVIEGGRVSLTRVCIALITNALDHAVATVSVEVSSRGKMAELRIRDDGQGFPEGMESRAFERFASSRSNASTEDRTRHYGIGLALVAEVAARHGGKIVIEQRDPGTGAVVRVSLPLANP